LCHNCGKTIAGEVMQAMGKYFHPEHFACIRCKQPLGTATFFQQGDGEAACESCYMNYLITKCAYCGGVITDQCVSALNQKWHPNHFICQQCSKGFPDGNFFEKDGKPYCATCFMGNFGPRCAAVGCGELITGQMINALGTTWHPHHFVCTFCKQPFTNGTFYEKAGKPFCETHANMPLEQLAFLGSGGKTCQGCKQPITAGQPSTEALGAVWHREHLLCAFCMTIVVPSSFVEHNGRAYCLPCKNAGRV